MHTLAHRIGSDGVAASADQNRTLLQRLTRWRVMFRRLVDFAPRANRTPIARVPPISALEAETIPPAPKFRGAIHFDPPHPPHRGMGGHPPRGIRSLARAACPLDAAADLALRDLSRLPASSRGLPCRRASAAVPRRLAGACGGRRGVRGLGPAQHQRHAGGPARGEASALYAERAGSRGPHARLAASPGTSGLGLTASRNKPIACRARGLEWNRTGIEGWRAYAGPMWGTLLSGRCWR